MSKSINVGKNGKFIEGEIYQQDILAEWNSSIDQIDAIITSPPFFDSTRYYITNWLRSWFLGWEKKDFEEQKDYFIDEKQKINIAVYDTILRKSKERLKTNGIILFHLGKSPKKDMAVAISFYAKK